MTDASSRAVRGAGDRGPAGHPGTTYTLRYRETPSGWELRPANRPAGPLELSEILSFVRSNVSYIGVFDPALHTGGPVFFARAKGPSLKYGGIRLASAWRVELPFDFMTREIERRLRRRGRPGGGVWGDPPELTVERAGRVLRQEALDYGIRLVDGLDVREAVPDWEVVFRHHAGQREVQHA